MILSVKNNWRSCVYIQAKAIIDIIRFDDERGNVQCQETENTEDRFG